MKHRVCVRSRACAGPQAHTCAAAFWKGLPVTQRPLALDADGADGAWLVVQVYAAVCKPLGEKVAIKILDLERQDPDKLARAPTTF